MLSHSPIFWLLAAVLVGVAVVGGLTVVSSGDDPIDPEAGATPDIILGLTAEARESLQNANLAFPSDQAGFSAYYRVATSTLGRMQKDTIDNYIFGPVPAGVISRRNTAATIKEMGDNYTVAALPLLNINDIPSTVNLYYDDQGWVVAYLPKDAPSSQVWQARGVDENSPRIDDADLGKTLLLEAINVALEEALEGTKIASDDAKLGYYHFKYPTADNFLMMAAAVGEADKEYPISFTVPATLTVKEVSVTLWITQLEGEVAPCAKVALDDADLIAEKCAKGIYHASPNLTTFNAKTAHAMKLNQSTSDQGAVGALLMVVYDKP